MPDAALEGAWHTTVVWSLDRCLAIYSPIISRVHAATPFQMMQRSLAIFAATGGCFPHATPFPPHPRPSLAFGYTSLPKVANLGKKKCCGHVVKEEGGQVLWQIHTGAELARVFRKDSFLWCWGTADVALLCRGCRSWSTTAEHVGARVIPWRLRLLKSVNCLVPEFAAPCHEMVSERAAITILRAGAMFQG